MARLASTGRARGTVLAIVDNPPRWDGDAGCHPRAASVRLTPMANGPWVRTSARVDATVVESAPRMTCPWGSPMSLAWRSSMPMATCRAQSGSLRRASLHRPGRSRSPVRDCGAAAAVSRARGMRGAVHCHRLKAGRHKRLPRATSRLEPRWPLLPRDDLHRRWTARLETDWEHAQRLDSRDLSEGGAHSDSSARTAPVGPPSVEEVAPTTRERPV